MKISDNYMRSHDIDWFCCVDRHYLLHFASNGEMLPEFIADRERLWRAQRAVASLPLQLDKEPRYNRGHIEELSHLQEYDETRYLASFKLFALKGFYSFDYEWKREEQGGEYKLIVGPVEPLKPELMDFIDHYLPQISLEDIDIRYREMFQGILTQIEANN